MNDDDFSQPSRPRSSWSTWSTRAKRAFESWRMNAEEPVAARYTAGIVISGLLAAVIAISPFTYPLLATARGQADPVNAAIVAQPRGGLRRALLRKRTNEVQAAGSYGTEAIGKIVLYGQTMARARAILASVGSAVPRDAVLAAVSDALDAHVTEARIRLILINPNTDFRVASLDSVTSDAWGSQPSAVSDAPQAAQPPEPVPATPSATIPSPIPGLKSAPVTPATIKQAPVTQRPVVQDSTRRPL